MTSRPSLTTAQRACTRCQGRRYGDCSSDCKYFLATATPSELDAALLPDEFDLVAAIREEFTFLTTTQYRPSTTAWKPWREYLERLPKERSVA